MEKYHFSTSNQESGQRYDVNDQDPCIEQINNRRVIVVSRVAPGLAQWIALIYISFKKDLNRPSREDTWPQVEPSRCLTHRNSDAQKQLHHNPICEVARAFRSWGPPRRQMSLGPLDWKDTWCAIRLLSFSPIAILKHKDHPPPSRET
jgi:hypothetical protein